MLSSGLWSPFNYTRQVKDEPSIIYMAGIQGEIRDAYREEKREEERWGKTRQRDVDLKRRWEMEAGKRVGAAGGKNVNGKRGRDWARRRWRAEYVKANALWDRWSGFMTPGVQITLAVYSKHRKGAFHLWQEDTGYYVWKKWKKRDFRGEDIMRGKMAQFTCFPLTVNIHYLCHKCKRKTEADIQRSG